MKYLIFILLFSFSLLKGQSTVNNSGYTKSDIKHVYAGMIISTGTGIACSQWLLPKKTKNLEFKSAGLGILVGTLAGQLKEEVWDLRWHKGTYSNIDKVNTWWGSMWGGWNTMVITIHLNKEKKPNRYSFAK